MSIIFYLLQVYFLKSKNINSIILIDDISSELNNDKIVNLLKILLELDNQIFITTIDAFNISKQYKNNVKQFVIENGFIKDMV